MNRDSSFNKTLPEQQTKFDSVLDDSLSTIKSLIAVVLTCPHCSKKLGIKLT